MAAKLLKLKHKLFFLSLFGKIRKHKVPIELPLRQQKFKRAVIILPINKIYFHLAIDKLQCLKEPEAAELYFVAIVPENNRTIFPYTPNKIINYNLENISDITINNKFDVIVDLNPDFNYEIAMFINKIDSRYKIGFKSEYSDKFFNIQYDLSQTGILEVSYEQINRLLAQS